MPDQFTNGTCPDSPEEEGREPSYVRLARCLSGYSTLNYDPSKQVIGRSPSPMRPSQEIVEANPSPAPAVEVTTSFIEQRIERLYGPGSLAQVFYSRSASKISKTPKPDPTQPKIEVDHTKSVPVMRLLRPEFRAQLTSVSSPQPSTTPKRPIKKSNKDTVDACNLTKRTLLPSPTSPSEEVKDGHYFLKKLDEKVKGLERVARDCEIELEECKSETGCGVLRALSGKARLLIAEKLNQFRGLCQNNINRSKTEDFPTTNEDLAGFWDMVMIQVCEVHTQFGDLDKLRKNDWDEEVVLHNSDKAKNSKPVSSIFKNKSTNSTNKVQSEASKARDAARRKLLQERRQAMKQQAAPTPQQASTSLFIV